MRNWSTKLMSWLNNENKAINLTITSNISTSGILLTPLSKSHYINTYSNNSWLPGSPVDFTYPLLVTPSLSLSSSSSRDLTFLACTLNNLVPLNWTLKSCSFPSTSPTLYLHLNSWVNLDAGERDLTMLRLFT